MIKAIIGFLLGDKNTSYKASIANTDPIIIKAPSAIPPNVGRPKPESSSPVGVGVGTTVGAGVAEGFGVGVGVEVPPPTGGVEVGVGDAVGVDVGEPLGVGVGLAVERVKLSASQDLVMIFPPGAACGFVGALGETC